MVPKPDHLGPDYGAQFSDPSVVAAYHLRPPYLAEVFDVLTDLIVDRPRVVLDAGTGTGEIARPLATRVDRVDAVDPSPEMIARGRGQPGGDASNLRWLRGFAEDVALSPPYALIVAAASLHWMEWTVVLPRFRDLLTPRGVLAVVEDREVSSPWGEALGQLCAEFSTNRTYRPYKVIDEIETRGLFRQSGRYATRAVPFFQPVADYVESFHARNGFSRDRMAPGQAAAFDHQLRLLVAPFAADGIVRMKRMNEIVWGVPTGLPAPQ